MFGGYFLVMKKVQQVLKPEGKHRISASVECVFCVSSGREHRENA